MPLPGALLPWVEMRFLKVTDEGLVPNSGGFVEFRETDLTTLQPTYSDSDLTMENENPIELDVDGRPPDPIYLLPVGYSVYVSDSDSNLLYSIPFVEDVGSAFLSSQANIQATGTTATTSPYTVQSTDNTVTVDSAEDPFIVQLPAAADRGTPLLVKSNSAVEVRVTPAGAETIDLISAYVVLPAAGSPPLPGMTLLSDGTSNWVIASTVGL